MRIASKILLFLVIGLFAASCETTNTKPVGARAKADHKPNFDYWQNGGGACCPTHAKQFKRN